MASKRLYLVWIMVAILITLSACEHTKNTVLEPSKLFYVHDLEHILLNATSWSIFNYGEELHQDSKASDIPSNIQGSQVVVLTYVGDESDINSTQIFNNWGIGENNMGILIILFFSRDNDEYIYNSLIFEIGTKMSEYLSAFSANQLVTDYFDDSTIPLYDYDARLMSLYYGILSYIYLNIYDYDSYNHESYMDVYYEVQYEYMRAIPKYELYESWFSSYWFWIIFAVMIVFGGLMFQFIPLLFFSRGVRFKGGGGNPLATGLKNNFGTKKGLV